MSEASRVESSRGPRIENQPTRAANSWLARHWEGVRIALGIETAVLAPFIPAAMVEPGNPEKMVATYMIGLAAEAVAAILFIPDQSKK